MQKKLLLLSGFIGIGAYFGGLMMFLSPDGGMWGMDAILPYMQLLPCADVLFRDFIFSGVMLILVNGVCNTVAVVGLGNHKRYGVFCAGAASVMLLCWLAVQWVIFAVNPLTTLYTVLGIAQLMMALKVLKYERE